jgi:serine/threonine-protein kinase HipA
MNSSTARAAVFLNDRYVGALQYRQGRSSFKYEDLEPGHPVFGLRFEYDPDYGSRPEVSTPSWFANLLPERGSGLRRLYSRQLGRSDASDFLLLLHLGQDLPGAVRVAVDGALPAQMTAALEEAHATEARQKMSFSLAGLQLKFSMCADGDGFRLPGSDELGDWIIKFPSGVYPSLPENENVIMTWASHAGIQVPPHRLVSADRLHGIPDGLIDHSAVAFAVQRFDRGPSGRLHQEDFAQVLDALPAAKGIGSQNFIGEVVVQECSEADFEEYLRRLVFCIAAGNTDEHLKNWSLQYPAGRPARLSPAYDLVAVTSYSQYRNDTLTLPIAGQADTRILGIKHFRRFADELGADENSTATVVIDTVQRIIETWPLVGENAATPSFVREHIDQRLRTLPLLNM